MTAAPVGRPVHPHVCGDNSSRLSHETRLDRFTPTCVGTTHIQMMQTLTMLGSPPRVWGQRTRVRPHEGNDSVHPHVCGDNAHHWPIIHAGPRFTPTCVGTTNARICFDNAAFGSPPRVWGQHDGRRTVFHQRRFTPTCVGTTRAATKGRWSWTVHPHVCGDNDARFLPTVRPVGSPPRVWGQRHPHHNRDGCQPVHPHVCGDNVAVDVLGDLLPRFTPTCVGTTSPKTTRGTRVFGSPPRVWGQQLRLARRSRRTRFTPTCVGTTSTRDFLSTNFTVHPHVCGDNALAVGAGLDE